MVIANTNVITVAIYGDEFALITDATGNNAMSSGCVKISCYFHSDFPQISTFLTIEKSHVNTCVMWRPLKGV